MIDLSIGEMIEQPKYDIPIYTLLGSVMLSFYLVIYCYVL